MITRLAFLLALLTCASVPAQQKPFDLLIEGGRVMDGTGNPWFKADVGIRDGMIVAVGRLDGAATRERIDANGKIVAPGFIDLHSHADGGLASREDARRAAPNLVSQGITTLLVNQDGRSSAPIPAQIERFRELGIGPNAIVMIGHGTVRRMVMKNDFRRPASLEEVEAMREQVRKYMDAGAWGMSAGLEYVPGRWSSKEEVLAVVGELAPYAGVYILHERSSGADPMWYLPSQDEAGAPTMLENIVELIEVAEKTGIAVVATHIKVKGANYWGTSKAMVHLIERARARGARVYADQYPYNTTGTDGRVVLVPGWVLRGGPEDEEPAAALERVLADPAQAADLRRDMAHEINRRGSAENIIVMDHPEESFILQSLAQLAKRFELDAVEMGIKMQLEGYRDRPGGARVRGYSLSEIDVEEFAPRPWVATATDAGIALPGDGPVHPRFYGSFPRKIRHYAMERGIMSVEDVIRSGTSLPAQILGIRDRGMVREGFHADLLVFDPEEIRDLATAFEPHQYSEGVEQVLVGGEYVVKDGELTGALPGKVLLLTENSGQDSGR
ncbi:MAG: N-acyl-D-amino-acid deacylase family protein [Planctomycetota bacterium]|jgi:N-acyl-D-amino-acid deacylase